MKRILLIAALIGTAQLANAAAVITAHPVAMVSHPVTVAPVARTTVTSAHVSEPAPVTRTVTHVVTPVIIPRSDTCSSERKQRGDCDI